MSQAIAILTSLSDGALSRALGLLQDLRGESPEDGAMSDDLPVFSREKNQYEYSGSGADQSIAPEKSRRTHKSK